MACSLYVFTSHHAIEARKRAGRSERSGLEFLECAERLCSSEFSLGLRLRSGCALPSAQAQRKNLILIVAESHLDCRAAQQCHRMASRMLQQVIRRKIGGRSRGI